MYNAKELVCLCRQKQMTIGSCESLTAGLFSSCIASVPGASLVLKGALVTYHTQIKETVAGIDSKLIETYGVISKECAQAMAENTRRILDVDYCVSFTGNAGPDAMEGKPAGCVFCAIQGPNVCFEKSFLLEMERNDLRQEVVDRMIDELYILIAQGE